MPVYDFSCVCGQVTELRKGYEVVSVPCPVCGNEARRAAVYREQGIVTESAPIPLSDRRYNVSRFQEVTQELDYSHTKAENEVGHELPAPNIYKHAMARAEGIDPNVKATGARRAAAARARAREEADAGTHS